MLNNLTNFWNIITTKMIKKVPEASDLISLGTRDSRYGGKYKSTAITVADFVNSIPAPPIGVQSVVAGTNVTVNNVDPLNPIVNSLPDGVQSIVAGTNVTVNNTDPSNPIVSATGEGLKGINSLIKLSSGDIVSSNISASASYFNVALTADRLYTIPFIPNEDITTSNLLIYNNSATASTFARILIYSDLNGLPNTKLYESASLDLSTTGQKTATTTQILIAGTIYWMTLHASSSNSINTHSAATLSVIKMTANNGGISSYYSSAVFGSAPTTFGALTPTAASFPFIGITKA